MFDKRAHHVPEDYIPAPIDGGTMWTSGAPAEHGATSTTRLVAEQALAAVPRLLDFRATRAVHVVVYESLDHSRSALGRDVPSTFLLAPLHTTETAVIALHSARLDPRNGEPRRMLRHMCHEVAHVCAAERTGSVKRLGDGDGGMRLRPWVDEGFAVCVAGEVTEHAEAVERALDMEKGAELSLDEIDAELRALDSPRRRWAFASATSRVWRGVQQRGFRFVFDHLDTPERWT